MKKLSLFYGMGLLAISLFLLVCFQNGFANKIVKKTGAYSLDLPNFTKPVVNPKSGYKEITLSNFKGKVVILNFFATWCPPCREEIPMIVKFYNENKNKNIVVIGVNSSQGMGESINGFINEFKITYPIINADATLASGYQIMGLPTSFLIGPNGSMVKMQVGDINQEFLDLAVRLAKK